MSAGDAADHRGVIGAIFGRSDTQSDVTGEFFSHHAAEFGVTGNATGDDNSLCVVILCRFESFADETIHNGALITCSGIRNKLRIVDIFTVEMIQQSGFDAAEAEIVKIFLT